MSKLKQAHGNRRLLAEYLETFDGEKPAVITTDENGRLEKINGSNAPEHLEGQVVKTKLQDFVPGLSAPKASGVDKFDM